MDPPRRRDLYLDLQLAPQGHLKVLWETENRTMAELPYGSRTTGIRPAMSTATKSHTHGWNLTLVWLQSYSERGETIHRGARWQQHKSLRSRHDPG
jgi:hypothetical protein